MKDLSNVPYFKPVEKITNVLMERTQNNNPMFFRVLVSYYFAKVASMMRCSISTMDRGAIPVSMYALNLATSGQGKGYSTNIMEEEVINEFRARFMEETFPDLAEVNLAKIATRKAGKNGTDPDDEVEKLMTEFNNLGALAFSFDSGTTPAVKQMRHKLLMANAGSINFEQDEVGSNLLGNLEVLTTFLELYDVGKVKQKLTKNTKDSFRGEEINGRTPTNMMLFGTPSKLLNGGKIEDEFYAMLDTGYARRFVFGYAKNRNMTQGLTAQEIYDMTTNSNSSNYLKKFSSSLLKLAAPGAFNRQLIVSKATTLDIINYRIDCETIANTLPDHQEVQKAEISHRYFKALKMAGAYAFIDGSAHLTSDHFYSAVKLVEDSGAAFEQILTRDKPYVKLAHYISSVGTEVTHADLQEDMPAYSKASIPDRKEMLANAIAWGYKNNIVIKKSYDNDIEFLSGESLAETDMSKLIVAYSQDIATNYRDDRVPWEELDKLTGAKGYHFINHHLVAPRRNEENCKQGFNLAVIDVDGGTSITTAKFLLSEYEFLLYETKRSTPQDNRFRLIFPLSHEIKLNAADYKLFMRNFYDFLPFDVDDQTDQRARKWLSHDGHSEYNKGEIIDGLMFIPKTKKSDDRQREMSTMTNLSAVERWFSKNIGVGNRSNNMIRYALMLVDSGYNTEDIKGKVLLFNSKLKEPLPEAEIVSTILQTVANALIKKVESNE